MWNFTQHGFVSVVAYDPTKDRNPDSPFPKIAKQAGTHLLVRARIKADLDQLKRVVPSLVIDTDSGADYAYRAVVTRSQFKKFMVAEIDMIDYDSHFKEAARDNSPKVEGRYSAMMGVWNAMANLQDIAPWSGGNRGWTETYGTGTSSKDDAQQAFWDSLVSDHQAALKTSPKDAKGAPTVEDFMADPGFYGGKDAWRSGSGPRTGFEPGDKVWGYFGQGEVVKATPRSNKPDLVLVQKKSGSVSTHYVSTYLVPDLTDYLKAAPSLSEQVQDIDLDKAYDMVLNARSAKVDGETLKRLDDNAFELVTRTQERCDTYSSEILDEVYSEVQWEAADGDGKRLIASQGTVPRKYEDEARRILDQVAAEVAGDAAGS